MASRFANDVVEFLKSNASDLGGQTSSVVEFKVVEKKSVVIVTVIFDNRTSKFVLKEAGKRWKVRDPVEICRINSTLRAKSDALRAALPDLRLFGPKQDWLAMEFVEGDTLEKCISSSRGASDGIRRPLKSLAKIVASLHCLSAESVGLEFTARRNRDYKKGFDKSWNTNILPCLLPSGLRTVDALYEYVSESVWTRTPNRLFMVDFQPKNVLVDAKGGVFLIDPDFGVGSPALATGFFLNGLNQLTFSHRNWVGPKGVAECQRIFLESYLAHVDDWVEEDLVFFYPWTMIESSKMQSLRSRFPKQPLRVIYSVFLRRYMSRLVGLDLSAATPSDIALFSV